ncbi:MAG: DUF4423 domain-containing protein, partial [Bdellovibrionales bacterium]|nr:DUF4423 domain-containing protein [Bdellovibrionales bacterium]
MIVEHLKKVFADRSRNNTSYSLRAFARSLGIDSSTLSAILNNKRPVTLKMARRLIDGLGITDVKEAQMLIMSTLSGHNEELGINYTEFELVVAETLASWEHFAILSLLEIPSIAATPKEISRRLNIPLGIVMECLTRLRKLGLVMDLESGHWRVTGKDMTTPSGVPNPAIREGNRQYIIKAIESLDSDPVEVREISGTTVAISKSRLNDAKKLIRDF